MRNIGRFRKAVTIEQQVQTQDGTTGEITVSWVSFAQTFAAVQPMSGRELLLAQQVKSTVDTVIQIPYRDGVLPSMRVVRGDGLTYDINAVIEDGHTGRDVLTLQCSSGENSG